MERSILQSSQLLTDFFIIKLGSVYQADKDQEGLMVCSELVKSFGPFEPNSVNTISGIVKIVSKI